ncbi:uncharacterized protein JCM6883_006227 [Sporobolomyces salmoneus]|uniref:uncharacterized protein n=1 Tax=Sporobolomyces salmoneus TaxID=183962 RepID=UPI00316DD08C
MNNQYGHSQEATDDSVLSLEGLAELVQNGGGNGDRLQGYGLDQYTVEESMNELDRRNTRSHHETHASSRSTSHPSSQSPPLSYPVSSLSQHSEWTPSPPPSVHQAPPNSLDYHSTSSDWRSFTPSTAPSSSDPYLTFTRRDTGRDGSSKYPGSAGKQARLDRSGDLSSGHVAEGVFEGAAGGYQHGIGYERDTLRGVEKNEAASGAKFVKRMKRLQREFGSTERSGSHAGSKEGGTGDMGLQGGLKALKEDRARKRSEDRERTGVDEKGRLVVTGQKKRSTTRWMEGIGAIAVGVGSIGASLLTHPKETPPPSGTIPLVALYIAPFVSLLLTIYLFLIQPCLFRRRSHTKSNLPPSISPQAPVQTSNCCSGFGSGKNRIPRGQVVSPSINLMIDPSLLAQHNERLTSERRDVDRHEKRRRRKEKRRKQKKAARQRERRQREGESDLETDLLSSSSSFFTEDSSDSEADAANPRSFASILSHVALEENWLAARKQVKWNAVWDFSLGAIWGGLGVWAIGFNGEKCPIGGFEGYCNLYNTALAFAILESLAFFLSFAFDCLDLSRSKVSPRHRQQRLTSFERGRSRDRIV